MNNIAPYFDQVTEAVIRAAYDRMGYTYCDSGDYNVNIFGIRTYEFTSNAFNDVLGITYKVNGEWKIDKYRATVDPGEISRLRPVNKNGCAIIVPGQYRGCWRLGLHKGKYPALVQNKPIKLYRDNNQDNVLNHIDATIVEEMAGINIHKAGANSKQVDSWSAGCMVIANQDDWDQFYSVIEKSAQRFGEVFTATVFTEHQVFGE